MTKIFLSYAHQDIAMAKRIYADLRRFGLYVWLDSETLLPGQDWGVEIEKAIEESSFFIALLSSQSVDRVGYVQKELKIALDKLEMYPEGGVYLIPVRVDQCEPAHRRIKKIQMIDLFPESKYENGLKKILQVICPGRLKLRSKPISLTPAEATEMIIQKGFYDESKNPGGAGLAAQFEPQNILGDRVVIDSATALMWQQSGSDTSLLFEMAIDNLNELNRNKFAGFNDWRLPTLEEAMSLVIPKKIDPLALKESQGILFIDSCFDSNQKWIWTCDDVKGLFYKWVVFFDGGSCDFAIIAKNSVRAVRML
ncbi:MAG: TIR domain-containing protein [Nitrospirae bacterium]|nr:TIR domain-containing protein [Nitrospirota bacterium]